MIRTLCLSASTIALVLASAALACEKHSPKSPAQTELKQFGTIPHATPRPGHDAEVPLWQDLASSTWRVSTKSAMAQRYFDQGVMLAFGFNHAEARRSFQAAQRLDPSCAMCFWGEALVLGPNINAPMAPELNEAALRAQARAAALAKGASARERALIAALGQRYAADSAKERASLDRVYADAMIGVAKRFPADQNIATLAAEALMDLSPWDYWQAGGSAPKGRTAEIVSLLERVLAANPDHPGAIHFYIHTVEASDSPQRAEAYADRLKRQQLSTGHLVHMPSHIYYRVGRYADSLQVNIRAAEADEAFFKKVKPEGIYAGGYYPHNTHFLMVSAQMAGDGPTAVAAAQKLARTVSDDAARAMPGFVQPIKAAPLFAHAQFSAPETVLALPEPPQDMPYLTALWHYARGAAFARQGEGALARGEAEAIARIALEADFKSLAQAGVPAADVLGIARQVLLGRIAQAAKDHAAAVVAFEAAATIEDRLGYMEPPFWYYPVRQSLGAALLMSGAIDRAEKAFADSLKAAPHNGWSLYGLQQVHKVRANAAEAERLAQALEKVWAGDKALLSLERL